MNKLNIGVKITIFSGILTTGTGALIKDANIFNLGIILGTAGITALRCQRNGRRENINRKILLNTLYNKKIGD